MEEKLGFGIHLQPKLMEDDAHKKIVALMTDDLYEKYHKFLSKTSFDSAKSAFNSFVKECCPGGVGWIVAKGLNSAQEINEQEPGCTFTGFGEYVFVEAIVPKDIYHRKHLLTQRQIIDILNKYVSPMFKGPVSIGFLQVPANNPK